MYVQSDRSNSKLILYGSQNDNERAFAMPLPHARIHAAGFAHSNRCHVKCEHGSGREDRSAAAIRGGMPQYELAAVGPVDKLVLSDKSS